MFAGILGGLAATGVREHERYLLEDERYLVAGTFEHDTLRAEFDALREFARSHEPSNALARGVVSWHDREEISIRGALAVAREVIAESPFGGGPAVFVVHGPPIEPTRRHVHVLFPLRTDRRILRLSEARRELWQAAKRAGEHHGFTVPERSEPTPFALRISRAARYWQTNPMLDEWLRLEVAPKVSEAIAAARTWDDIHAILAPYGLRYVGTPRGGGAICDDSRNVAVRASAVDLRWSRTSLEERLGPLREREAIRDAALLPSSYRHAATTADDGEIERHRAARAAWDELYGPRIATERQDANAAYARAATAIRETAKLMQTALRELRPPADERRAIANLIASYRKGADAEALQTYSERLQRAYAAAPRKPSRKLREWQKDRFTQTEPPARIRAIDSRSPEPPRLPWRAVPSLDGKGMDLYIGHDRLATDYGDRIDILDADISAEALDALALPQRLRVEGAVAVREAVRVVGDRRALDVRDGGEMSRDLDPLHATLPEHPVARRCLALMDALRVRPSIDGQPYRANDAVPLNARRIELRAPDVVLVAGEPPDLSTFVARIQPQVEGPDFAIYRCADAASADELRATARRSHLQVVDGFDAEARLRFADVARYERAAPKAQVEYRDLADALQRGVDATRKAPAVPTPARQERPKKKQRQR